MRCGCPECGAYMAHAESTQLGCVCPACGQRCHMCLGTLSPLSREQVLAFARHAQESDGFFAFDGRESTGSAGEKAPDFEEKNPM